MYSVYLCIAYIYTQFTAINQKPQTSEAQNNFIVIITDIDNIIYIMFVI